MRAKWTKLDNGKSFLVLVFGHVSAEVVNLGPPPADSPNPAAQWGILTHPFMAETIVGTLTDAQARAEAILRGVLSAATTALG